MSTARLPMGRESWVETGWTSTSARNCSISARHASAVTRGGVSLGGAEPVGSACCRVAKRVASAGERSIGCQLEMTARAPGRRMRRSSARPRARSGKNISPKREKAASCPCRGTGMPARRRRRRGCPHAARARPLLQQARSSAARSRSRPRSNPGARREERERARTAGDVRQPGARRRRCEPQRLLGEARRKRGQDLGLVGGGHEVPRVGVAEGDVVIGSTSGADEDQHPRLRRLPRPPLRAVRRPADRPHQRRSGEPTHRETGAWRHAGLRGRRQGHRSELLSRLRRLRLGLRRTLRDEPVALERRGKPLRDHLAHPLSRPRP